MKKETTPKVSIIIPNFNGEKYIENCLDSLRTQRFTDSEIIVIDDCSKDNSLALLKNYEEVQLLVNKKNSGFAASVNRGIKAAQGEYVLLLNNDVVVPENFVEKLYEAIAQDERIFSASSKMIRYYERDKIDDTGDFYNILGWAYKRGDGKSVEKLQHQTKVFSTCAGAGIYRRKIFDEIGYFDEHYFAYMEDVDVSYRGLIHGYKNIYAPDAHCFHIGSATTADGNKYSAFKVKISARNNIYTAWKNMPLLQFIVNLPFLALGFLIKGSMFTVKGFGGEYWRGLLAGIKGAAKITKTKFKLKNLGNYLKIEVMLIGNVFRYIGEKVSK
ncbi:MAG: glycosyltransferase family 2 protein [Eubacterium sp.]|nr:glycosyltransferase family 2 protein [Eubacterium sp.]